MNRNQNAAPRHPMMIPAYFLGRPISVYLERYRRDRNRKKRQTSS